MIDSGEFCGNKWTTFRHEINKPNVSQYYSSTSSQRAFHRYPPLLLGLGTVPDSIRFRFFRAQFNSISIRFNICTFFHRSSPAAETLKRNQKMLGLPHHKLITDDVVRWNSAFEMISRILEQQHAVTAAFLSPEVRCFLLLNCIENL